MELLRVLIWVSDNVSKIKTQLSFRQETGFHVTYRSNRSAKHMLDMLSFIRQSNFTGCVLKGVKGVPPWYCRLFWSVYLHPPCLINQRQVHEICPLLGYYAASNENRLPTFRDNVLVPSSRIKKSKSFLLGLLDSWRRVNKGLPHYAT
jgi:hypothetical protein